VRIIEGRGSSKVQTNGETYVRDMWRCT